MNPYTYEEGKMKTGNILGSEHTNHLAVNNRLWMYDGAGQQFTLANFWARIAIVESDGKHVIMGRDTNDQPFKLEISASDFWDADAIESTFQRARGSHTTIMPGAGGEFAEAVAHLTNTKRMASPLFCPN